MWCFKWQRMYPNIGIMVSYAIWKAQGYEFRDFTGAPLDVKINKQKVLFLDNFTW